MLYFDRIDVSEGIDVKKTSEPKECDICLYWYFLDIYFLDFLDISFSQSFAMGLLMY